MPETADDDRSTLRRAGQAHIRTPRLETPFHARLAALSTTNDWYDWAGYKAPHSVFDDELEYFAIRSTSALFDISPMVKYRIRGAGAERFLNRLTLRDVRKLKVGRVQYTAWCDDHGHVLMTARFSGSARPISGCAARNDIFPG